MVGRVNSELRPRPGPPGRHLHWHLVRRRRRLLRAGGVAALFAVVSPGVLAGLSDDDPAGIATYSILGAKFGYRLLWVLAVSMIALIVFHELGARMGVVTEKGLLALVRDHYGPRGAIVALTALVVANLGRLCAEFAGVATGLDLLAGVSRCVSVPLAAIGVSLLVLRGSFHRVEHVLLALSSVFIAYVVSGLLAPSGLACHRARPGRARHAADPRRGARPRRRCGRGLRNSARTAPASTATAGLKTLLAAGCPTCARS